jgi:putative ABC transport system ATP-binding protein
MNKILISAKKVSRFYQMPAEVIRAVDGIDLEIQKGDFISLMGPSGSGKTTLLDVLGCLDRVSSGKLEVLGRDVSSAHEGQLARIRRGNIGFVFQDFLLIPTLTALENVELSLFFSRLKDRQKAKSMLEKVGLGKRLHHVPGELSGGEKQRVALARALAISPKLLFADEPTGNLDAKSSGEIFGIFSELHRTEGLTIVFSTHNAQLGSQAGRIVYLKDGKFVNRQECSLFGG